MYGVNHLAADTLTGDILLNIDNETMGEFVVGSAGGVNVTASMAYKPAEAEADDVAVKISLKGCAAVIPDWKSVRTAPTRTN